MGSRTGNPEWKDFPDTSTMVTAARLNALEDAIDDSAEATHGHSAGDVTSGTLAAARLGSGTANSSTFLRGDGTWAAPPGSSAPDASTSTKGIVQLTNHLGGTATAPTVRSASTTQTGIVELATNTEATTGTDTARAVTPAGVKAVVDALTIPDSPGDIGAAPAAHSHPISDVTNLQTTLNGKAAASHTHDDRYYTETEADGRFVRTVNGTGPDGSGNVVVSGGGGGASTLDDLTDVDTTGAATGQVLTFDGSEWVADAPSAGTVTSTSISDSTATGRAVLTAADAATARGAIGAGTSSFSGAYADLSGKPTLGSAAAANTGDFAPALGADDNYVTDAEKAALHSHANKTALDAVSGVNTGDQDLSGYATTAHTHAGGDITSGTVAAARLPSASTSASGIVELATTAEATTGTDTARAVTPAGVKAVADTKAATSHSHAAADVTSGTLAIARIPTGTTSSTVSLGNHTHDGRYYTETEVDNLLAGKAPATQAINARTGAYTLVAADAGKLVRMTVSTAANLTVPANVFTAGQRVDIADRGSARVTVVAGSGMTVNAPPGGSLVMEGRYAYASLVFISATEADLVGLVAAP